MKLIVCRIGAEEWLKEKEILGGTQCFRETKLTILYSQYPMSGAVSKYSITTSTLWPTTALLAEAGR